MPPRARKATGPDSLPHAKLRSDGRPRRQDGTLPVA